MEHLSAGDVLLSLGGGSDAISGSDADYLRGEFEFDSIVAERILSVLPKAITLRPTDGKPFPWVDVCCAFMLEEAMNGLAGAASMISRLLDLLFVRTLRTWASEGAPTMGWLAGAVDERIGKVLAAMHENFAVDWTLAKLAQQLPCLERRSRTGFKRLLALHRWLT